MLINNFHLSPQNFPNLSPEINQTNVHQTPGSLIEVSLESGDFGPPFKKLKISPSTQIFFENDPLELEASIPGFIPLSADETESFFRELETAQISQNSIKKQKAQVNQWTNDDKTSECFQQILTSGNQTKTDLGKRKREETQYPSELEAPSQGPLPLSAEETESFFRELHELQTAEINQNSIKNEKIKVNQWTKFEEGLLLTGHRKNMNWNHLAAKYFNGSIATKRTYSSCKTHFERKWFWIIPYLKKHQGPIKLMIEEFPKEPLITELETTSTKVEPTVEIQELPKRRLWTVEEDRLLLQALKQYPSDWKKISEKTALGQTFRRSFHCCRSRYSEILQKQQLSNQIRV